MSTYSSPNVHLGCESELLSKRYCVRVSYSVRDIVREGRSKIEEGDKGGRCRDKIIDKAEM